MKHLIKSHSDVITVPNELKKIHEEYTQNGYKTESPVFNTFSYWLDDGTKINVYWENGAFYEEF